MMEGWLYNGTPEMRAEQQLNLVLVPIWILMPIMCLVAGLRLWVRRRQLAYEDAILFGAVLCSIAFNVTSIICKFLQRRFMVLKHIPVLIYCSYKMGCRLVSLPDAIYQSYTYVTCMENVNTTKH